MLQIHTVLRMVVYSFSMVLLNFIIVSVKVLQFVGLRRTSATCDLFERIQKGEDLKNRFYLKIFLSSLFLMKTTLIIDFLDLFYGSFCLIISIS